MAVSSKDSCWQSRATWPSECPLCCVEFSSQHKHTTRRHCRACGGIFCYLCTYDKGSLMLQRKTGLIQKCLPWFGPPPQPVDLHVCIKCYDHLPAPRDGLRRCRFCSQRVRQLTYAAHVSVCEERYAELARLGNPGAQPTTRQRTFSGASATPTTESYPLMQPSPAGTNSPMGPTSTASPHLPQLPPLSEERYVSSFDPSDTELDGGAASASGGRSMMLKPPPMQQAQRLDLAVDLDTTSAGKSELPEELTCKICLTNEANALIRRCGHAVACVYCLEKCDICPVCRKKIKEVIRIYRS